MGGLSRRRGQTHMADEASEQPEDKLPQTPTQDSTTVPAATPPDQATTPKADSSKQPVKDGKVVVKLQAVGGAPPLRQTKFKINATEPFEKVVDFIRRQLNRDTVFLYCNSSFAPSLDETIGDLATCFHVDGQLVVNY